MNSPSLNTKSIPQNPALYQGPIKGAITKNNIPAFVKVEGENLILESFRGPHTLTLQSYFGKVVVVERDELADLTAIFGEDAKRQLDDDSAKTCMGNLFSGYAIIEKVSQKIIGSFSFDPGREAGEAEFSLEIGSAYRNKGYGKETVALAASLGFILYQHQYTMTTNDSVSPVFRFTVSVLEEDHKLIKWISKLGLTNRGSINTEEGKIRVFSIEGSQICKSGLFSLKNFSWEVNCVSPVQKTATVSSPVLSSDSK
jgi:hypothetical protein